MSEPKHLLLGLTGSINIVNVYPYMAALQNRFGCRMHIMMTPAARSFIPESTLIHSIDGDVFVDLSEKSGFKMPHVELTHWADAIVVLPASAHSIARVAHGFAEDIVSATLLAAECPVFFFPSMYIGMWRKKSVQRNVTQLREDGYHVFPPQSTNREFSEHPAGGSLPSPLEVVEFIEKYYNKY
ncbi:MAG: hypothetical protein H0Z33_00870 [Bacillaceae bacterium]|nr:hypothetical protein [Bacillaceae bacterium]